MKQLTLNPQTNPNPLKRDTEGYNLMNNSSSLLCTKGYMNSQEFRHYLEANNLVTPQRILRYSLVLDNLHVFPLCLEDMLESKAIYKDYPFAFRASTHHKLYKAKAKELLARFLAKESMELNAGIKILTPTPTPTHLSKLHTVNGVMVYNTPTLFIPTATQYTKGEVEEAKDKGREVKSKSPSNSNSSEFDDNVVMSRQLGNLYPMHEAYFGGEEEEGHQEAIEVDTTNTDASYWDSILTSEGLGTRFDGVVGHAAFNGEECSTFEEGKDITREDRQEHIKGVSLSRYKAMKSINEINARTRARKEREALDILAVTPTAPIKHKRVQKKRKR